MAVEESDLAEGARRQLAVLVSSNLRPRQPDWPATLLLRVTTGSGELGYRMVPGGSCAP